ncbi:MAG: NAD(P)-binding domain-containing protein [Nostoc sp.]|uniref:NADPH-dependent F420 reductase n=1 Tax=Nostoc sp. TaxID=1180 RepID=UPI002FFAD560
MKISFIGYGSMAESLSSRWVGKHELFVAGRDSSKAQSLAHQLAQGTKAGSPVEAAEFGEVIVLATPHQAVFEAMEAGGGSEAFANKILLDINNPVDPSNGNYLTQTYDGVSLSEAIAAYSPKAKVVKAFNMCQAKVWQMEQPNFDGRRLVTLYCGDDTDAKRQVASLIEDVGSEPVDLGELKYARLLESAAAIVIKLLFSGRDPYTVLNLIQPEVKPIS